MTMARVMVIVRVKQTKEPKTWDETDLSMDLSGHTQRSQVRAENGCGKGALSLVSVRS